MAKLRLSFKWDNKVQGYKKTLLKAFPKMKIFSNVLIVKVKIYDLIQE